MSEKSILPLVWSDTEGPNIGYGEPIIYEFEGKEYEGHCLGWNRDYETGEPRIKVDRLNPIVGYTLIPVDKVWRPYDNRDRRIITLERTERDYATLREEYERLALFVTRVAHYKPEINTAEIEMIGDQARELLASLTQTEKRPHSARNEGVSEQVAGSGLFCGS